MNPNVLEEEPSKIEIKETLKKSYYTSVCCIIFEVLLLIIIATAINFIDKNLEENNFDAMKIQEVVKEQDFFEYYLTSAKTGQGVHEAFNAIIKKLYNKSKALFSEL